MVFGSLYLSQYLTCTFIIELTRSMVLQHVELRDSKNISVPNGE